MDENTKVTPQFMLDRLRSGEPLAELYDPDSMPDDLRAAHDRNDEILERIYVGRRFKNDTERLETLFQLYTEMTAKKRGMK
jgi:hypothetical protein